MKNKDLDILKKISKVEAPPFLLTNIEAKLVTQKRNRINISWSIVGSLAFSLILLINIIVIKNKVNNNKTQIEIMGGAFYSSPNNILYNE
tara:strand:+ start:56 stop:325 length:270 start_codon:yes stop_codon:yes gene_type:complete